MSFALFLVIGLCAGILAGLFGVGGGLIIVPALVFIAGFSQITASGISLVALLAPVGAGGVYAFYQDGKLHGGDIKVGLLISLGMFVGSYFGAKLALQLPDFMLKRAFAVFLVVVACRMWWVTTGKSAG